MKILKLQYPLDVLEGTNTVPDRKLDGTLSATERGLVIGPENANKIRKQINLNKNLKDERK